MTDRHAELLVASLLVGVGLVLRFWDLGAKGLSYDEAATAIMARATPLEILRFHWTATFEHPPLWQLIMHYWSRGFGQSEPMLRLLPALAGTLAIAATWWWLYILWPERRGLRLVTLGLVATAPVLVQYSQEARSYALLLAGQRALVDSHGDSGPATLLAHWRLLSSWSPGSAQDFTTMR